MLIPIQEKQEETPELRCQKDLIHNANSKEFCNERGFKQKLIDLLFKLGYYKNNRSIFSERN